MNTHLQEDDAAPTLIRNTGLDVRLGGEIQITQLALNAKDRDSDQRDIFYILKTEPTQGTLIRKLRAMTEGKTVVQFSHDDLETGRIYYRHSGSRTLTDFFEVSIVFQIKGHISINKEDPKHPLINVLIINNSSRLAL